MAIAALGVFLWQFALLGPQTNKDETGASEKGKDDGTSVVSEFLKSRLCEEAGVDHRSADAVERLVQALRSPKKEVRLAAIHALGKFGDSVARSIPELARWFKQDEDEELREAAAMSLGQLSSSSNRAYLILLEGLRSAKGALRRQAAFGLGWGGRPAPVVLRALAKALRDRDRSVQIQAARSLALIGVHARAVLPELRNRLRESSGSLRFELAVAIGRMDKSPPEVLPCLVQALKAKDPEQRLDAASTLGDFAAGRSSAPEYYGKMNFAPAINALADALADPEHKVQIAAAGSLGRMGPLNARAVRALVQALKDPERLLREFAARSLAQSATEAHLAIPALAELARKDPSDEAREAAAASLCRIDGKDAQWVSVLIDLLLRSSDPLVRGDAATDLGFIAPADPRVAPALNRALRDGEHFVRLCAKSALERLER